MAQATAKRFRGDTYVYLSKEGKKYAVYHLSTSGREGWQHPYEERKKCSACNPSKP